MLGHFVVEEIEGYDAKILDRIEPMDMEAMNCRCYDFLVYVFTSGNNCFVGYKFSTANQRALYA